MQFIIIAVCAHETMLESNDRDSLNGGSKALESVWPHAPNI